jgi:hypothetical protein
MRIEYKYLVTCGALLLILGSILVIPGASASVTELHVTPDVAEPGDTITISGKASPDEEVWVSSSFVISLPVSGGKYSRKFEGIYFPEGKKRFTVTAEPVQNIRIALWLFSSWLPPIQYPTDGPKPATDGRATITISLPVTIYGDEMDVTGKHDVKVYGDALDGATSVILETQSELQVTADSNGDFSFEIDTSGIPEGAFVISAGGINTTVYLGVTPTPSPTPTPTPTPSPTPTGNSGGTPDTTATPTPSPSATVTPAPSLSPSTTVTPAPSPSPSLLPSPSSAPGILTVRIDNLTVASGETVTATVRIVGIGGEGLSSAQINLTYDPEVVNVLSAAGSDFDEFMATIESGMVHMNGSQTGADGLKGDITFAQLQVKAVGKTGDRCELGVEVTDLVDNAGQVLTEHEDFEVVAGSLSITGVGQGSIPSIGLAGTAAMMLGAYLLLRKRRTN